MILALLTKFKAEIGIAVTIISLFFAISNYYENKGYNRAVVEFKDESARKLAKATSEAIKAAEIEVQNALARQRTLFDAELKRTEEDKQVEIKIKEIISEVETIKYVDSCGVIADDSFRLLNNSVSRVNGSTED